MDDEGNFIAIIGCGKKEDITSKLKLAIKDHYCILDETEIKLSQTKEVLTNQNIIKFSAEYTEDEEENGRDFSIEIVASY